MLASGQAAAQVKRGPLCLCEGAPRQNTAFSDAPPQQRTRTVASSEHEATVASEVGEKQHHMTSFLRTGRTHVAGQWAMHRRPGWLRNLLLRMAKRADTPALSTDGRCRHIYV